MDTRAHPGNLTFAGCAGGVRFRMNACLFPRGVAFRHELQI